MRETILLYGFDDGERKRLVTKALMPLGFRLKGVEPKEYLQPVGYLAGVKEVLPVDAEYDGEAFESEMMILSVQSMSRVDQVILALRKGGVGRINYKAVITPTNKDWDSVTLYKEISREHAVMSGQDAAKKAGE